MDGRGDGGQRPKHLRIDDARVGLSRHGVGGGEAKRGGDAAVEFVTLGMVAIEEGEERGLRAGGALDATEAQRSQAMLQVFQAQRQFLGPEGGPLADGSKLGGLKVRVAERGQVFPVLREGGERVDGVGQPLGQELHRVAEDEQVGVTADVLRGGAEVNDALGGRRRLLEGADVGHHVMAQAFFPLGSACEVDVVQGGFHLAERVGSDAVHAEVAFVASQRQPE